MNAWKNAEKIIEKLNEKGYAAYFVGGCVRDKLMHKTPADIDIATSVIPQEIKNIFPKTIDTGLKHGTVTVLEGGQAFEVTTFRTEGGYVQHRKPENVSFVQDVREDLKRRDFTMNAMAYHPEEGLIDPFGGRQDIEKGIIRCVGNAVQRFEEDALRMLRCVRFACQTGFEVEKETKAAVSERKHLLCYISAERIYAELIKCLLGDFPMAFYLSYETGLLEMFLPELFRCFETPQNTKYHLYDVGGHILHAVAASPKDKCVRLAALLHDVAKPLCRTTDEKGTDHFYGHEQKSAEMAEQILARLKADHKTKNCVVSVIRQHRWRNAPDSFSVKEKILSVGKENFPVLLDLMDADTAAHNPEETTVRRQWMADIRRIYQEILENKEPLSVKDLAVCGSDLLELGYRGTEIGDKLQALLLEVLRNPEQNKREILLERLKRK